MAAARASLAARAPRLRWRTERAHVLASATSGRHSRVHLTMLRAAWALRDGRELRGQLLRLSLVPLGHLFRRLPLGNTGRLDVSAFAPTDACRPEAAVGRWPLLKPCDSPLALQDPGREGRSRLLRQRPATDGISVRCNCGRWSTKLAKGPQALRIKTRRGAFREDRRAGSSHRHGRRDHPLLRARGADGRAGAQHSNYRQYGPAACAAAGLHPPLPVAGHEPRRSASCCATWTDRRRTAARRMRCSTSTSNMSPGACAS